MNDKFLDNFTGVEPILIEVLACSGPPEEWMIWPVGVVPATGERVGWERPDCLPMLSITCLTRWHGSTASQIVTDGKQWGRDGIRDKRGYNRLCRLGDYGPEEWGESKIEQMLSTVDRELLTPYINTLLEIYAG